MAVQNAGKLEFDVERLFYAAFGEHSSTLIGVKSKASFLSFGIGSKASRDVSRKHTPPVFSLDDMLHLRTESRKLVRKEFQELKRRREKYAKSEAAKDSTSMQNTE